jgi:hypothetical protein
VLPLMTPHSRRAAAALPNICSRHCPLHLAKAYAIALEIQVIEFPIIAKMQFFWQNPL